MIYTVTADLSIFSSQSQTEYSGGARQIDTYTANFEDDFSSDNISPAGEAWWTKHCDLGNTVEIASGVLKTSCPIIYQGDAYVEHAFASASYGYVEVKVKRISGTTFWATIITQRGVRGSHNWWKVGYRDDVPRVEFFVYNSSGTQLWTSTPGKDLGDGAWHTVKITSAAGTTRFEVDADVDVTAGYGTQISGLDVGHYDWPTNTDVGTWHYNDLTTNISESQLYDDGYWISQTLDFGADASSFGDIDWTETSPGASTVEVLVRSQSADSAWPTADGDYSVAVNGADISGLAHVTDGHRYIRVKINLVAGSTPTVSALSIDYGIAGELPRSFTM